MTTHNDVVSSRTMFSRPEASSKRDVLLLVSVDITLFFESIGHFDGHITTTRTYIEA
jgi:hypothetical protein